jgi:hypothetical protein
MKGRICEEELANNTASAESFNAMSKTCVDGLTNTTKIPDINTSSFYSVDTGSNQAGIQTSDSNVRDYPQPLQINYGKTA